MSEIWVAAAGVVIAAGSAAYSANQQKKAAAQASQSLANGQKPLELGQVPNPTLIDLSHLGKSAISQNTQNLPDAFGMANHVNLFNTNQAIRDYTKIQPYFTGIQSQLGKNATSEMRGELPSDVVGSIGRAAAQRGIEGGFAGGLNAGGPGSALGSLNLRNLGLSSLQLSQQGNQLGLDINRSAAAMAPNLFDVSSMFVTPNLQLQGQLANANIINDTNRINAGIGNDQASANTQAGNQLNYNQTQLALQSQLQQAQAVQGAANSVAGILQKSNLSTPSANTGITSTNLAAARTPGTWQYSAGGGIIA